MTGTVFDIKEFAVYDGPGIRTTVFMKGCPLRCNWCHNPEGLEPYPQLTVSPTSCLHCGKCMEHCPHPGSCIACGACLPYCEQGLRRIAGTLYTPEVLAARLLKGRKLLEKNGGGITFSGGEPLMQWQFVRETIRRLDGLHCAVETSGFATDEVFREVIDTFDFIMMDIKLTDPELHKKYTGVDNACILRHADMLAAADTPFVIRIPLIPGVNDNTEHFTAVAERICKAKALKRVELLPYHKTAGAKYGMVGKAYRPMFDPDQPVKIDKTPFEKRGIEVLVM